MHFKFASIAILGTVFAAASAADLPSCVASCIPAASFGTCGHSDASCLCFARNGSENFISDGIKCEVSNKCSVEDSIAFSQFCANAVPDVDVSSAIGSADATALATGSTAGATTVGSVTTAAAAATSGSSAGSGSSSPSSHPNGANQRGVSATLAIVGLSAIFVL